MWTMIMAIVMTFSSLQTPFEPHELLPLLLLFMDDELGVEAMSG